MQASIPANTQQKVCPRCGRRQAIDQFRRRRRDSELRCSECKSCRNAKERDQRRIARHGELGGTLGQLAAARSQDRLVAIASALHQRFGGPGGVAAIMRDHVDECRAAGRYAEVRKCLLGVMNLMRAADPTKKNGN